MDQPETASVVADESIDSTATAPETHVPAEDAPETPAEAPSESETDELADMYPDDAGEDDSGDEEPEDEEEDLGDDEPEPDPIAAPHSWKAEDKELFAKLPREQQEIIARRETERDRFVQSKANEAEQAKRQAAFQAREELATIRSQSAQQIEQIAALILPPQPDPRNYADRETYDRDRLAYEQSAVQYQELMQQAGAQRAQATQLEQANEYGQIVEELNGLKTELPDWFEEDALKLKPEVISRLQPIGEALGYSPELMAQARGHDLKALNVAHEWKAKADRWDDLQKRKMAGVRQAKKAPNLARPGASTGGKQATTDPLKLLYPND